LQRAHRSRAGTIWVDCWFVRDLRAPFGGYKKSGIGREGGKHSFGVFYGGKKHLHRFIKPIEKCHGKFAIDMAFFQFK